MMRWWTALRGVAWLVTAYRRWKLRHELYEQQPDRHPALSSVQVGELLPFKGTNWRVADVREQPIPALILVPTGETKASKIGRLRELRRGDRILTGQERRQRAAVPKYVAQGEKR